MVRSPGKNALSHQLANMRTASNLVPTRPDRAMTYYISKVFWLLAAPTSALVLIGASAALWAVLGNSNCAAWLAAAAACGLVIGAFTPIGLALAVPLEHRFPFLWPVPLVPLDGIIILPGGAGEGIDAVSKLSQGYPKARLAFCGFGVADKNLDKKLARLGVDRARIIIEPQPRTTLEDAFYSAALLKPKPGRGGCWSPQPCICRARSEAFGLPDFRWSPIR